MTVNSLLAYADGNVIPRRPLTPAL